MENYADRVFKNAKVYSVALDDTETRAQALAIKDGKFVFIGTDEEANNWIGPETQVTDCNGGSLLPGFGDAHMHFACSVRRFGVADVSNAVTSLNTTPKEVIKNIQRMVKEFADEHPDYPVIHGMGWEHAWFSGALGSSYTFTRHDLDKAVNDRPVILDSADGHIVMLNTAALEAAGVDKDFPEPEHGILGRDEDGVPTGYIQEPVLIAPIVNRIPNQAYTDEHHRSAMLNAQELLASKGFTLISDCMEEPCYPIIKELAEDGKLKMRLDCVCGFNDATREEDFNRLADMKKIYFVDDVLKLDTAKFFFDGNFAMIEPYTDEWCEANNLEKGSGTKDGLLWDVDHYNETVEKVQKAGFNIHVHSYGDLSTRLTIDAFENAQKSDPEHKLRNIIAHCAWVSDSDKKRMGELGVIASIQPQWEMENPTANPAFNTMVGYDRYREIYPNKSFWDNGVVVAFGSDFIVNYPEPIEAISVAMTRKYAKSNKFYENFKDEAAMAPEECISLKQAIKGWTINPAYQFHREDVTGSIEIGKSAELVWLEKDIEQVAPEDICLINVKETVFKGETSYKA